MLIRTRNGDGAMGRDGEEPVFSGEIISDKIIDIIFRDLENQLLDKNEINLDFTKVTFISVYFLERLENLVNRAKDLNVKIQIHNIQPNIYKVFQVARIKSVLDVVS